MRNGYRIILASAMLLFSLAASAAEEQSSCLELITATGYPHRLEMVAQLNAMGAWTIQSRKNGKAYGMWHNVRGGKVSCEQLSRSVFYRCTAAGRPCPPRQAQLEPEDD